MAIIKRRWRRLAVVLAGAALAGLAVVGVAWDLQHVHPYHGAPGTGQGGGVSVDYIGGCEIDGPPMTTNTTFYCWAGDVN